MAKRRRKKYPGVRKQGHNSYEVNFYLSGKRVIKTVHAESEGEAYAQRIQLMAQHGALKDNQSDEIPIDVTLQSAFGHYQHKEALLKILTS